MDLVQGILQKDKRAAARLITLIEVWIPLRKKPSKELVQIHEASPEVIGITGLLLLGRAASSTNLSKR